MVRLTSLLAAAAVLFAMTSCDGHFDSDDSNKINGSIHVPAGKPASDVHSVNGSIHVDDNANINSAGTVNGSIRLGAHATATSLKAVNGAISVGAGSHVSGSVVSVNGELTLDEGAEVSGSLTNVNGKIDLNGAHVGGDIKTVAGNISIMGASQVDGGIRIDKTSGMTFNAQDPVIVIGPGATVKGEMHFERKVRLLVSDHATIGSVSGATPESFTGDKPPA